MAQKILPTEREHGQTFGCYGSGFYPSSLHLMCLSRAASAFAQGATGTITGTVVDGTGASLPGATVNVTEAATGSVRTASPTAAGLFRFAALNPGRYSVAVELASFRTLNVADIKLLSTEVRDLGKLGIADRRRH